MKNGTVDLFKQTAPYRRVIVEEVQRYQSTVKDLGTGQSFSVQNTMPGHALPRPGDVWIVSNELSVWTYHKLIDPSSDGQPLATALDVALEMDARNEIVFRPFEFTRGSLPEVPHGAFIGERRFCEQPPSERWLLMDASDKSRHRYRALFDVIGTSYGVGDGSTTFTIPGQDDAFVSGGTTLVSYDYYSVTGGSDPAVTTTATAIPGLLHSFSIASTPADYQVEVEATIAIDGTYSGGGLPDAEVVLRQDGVDFSAGGFNHSLEYRPTANSYALLSGSWKVSFASTGAHTIDITVIKADATGSISVVRKNSSMSVKVFRSGSTVSVAGTGQWYICAE